MWLACVLLETARFLPELLMGETPKMADLEFGHYTRRRLAQRSRCHVGMTGKERA
jgi:hypothetical protein